MNQPDDGASATGLPEFEFSDPADPGNRPARLAVGVVGTGRVGPALGAALQLAGHRVVAASGVSGVSRRRAEVLLPGVRLVTPPQVMAAADLVLLTVPDDALPDLVAGLAATGAVRPGQILVHTSGAHGVAVMEPARREGALPLALHPAMTFTGTVVDVARLAGCPFGVTAPEGLRPVAEALVVEMGGEPEWVPEDVRPLYHTALAHGANHLVTLVAQAQELLSAAGVSEPGRLLGPLLGAALDNALRSGDGALTGPVARGDAGTVRQHLEQLRRVSPPALDAYRAMALATVGRALASGMLTAEAADALLDVLAEEGSGGRKPAGRRRSAGRRPTRDGLPGEGSAEEKGC